MANMSCSAIRYYTIVVGFVAYKSSLQAISTSWQSPNGVTADPGSWCTLIDDLRLCTHPKCEHM